LCVCVWNLGRFILITVGAKSASRFKDRKRLPPPYPQDEGIRFWRLIAMFSNFSNARSCVITRDRLCYH